MIKRKFIRMMLQRGESLSREDFTDCSCLLVLRGRFIVFNNKGEMVFRLNAGEGNVVSGKHELTGTATENETEVIIV